MGGFHLWNINATNAVAVEKVKTRLDQMETNQDVRAFVPVFSTEMICPVNWTRMEFSEHGKAQVKMPRDSRPPKRPLRLGLISNSDSHALWIRKMFSGLVAAQIIEVHLIAVKKVSGRFSWGQVRLFLRELWMRRSFWIYRLYRAIDRQCCRAVPDALARGRLDPIAPPSNMTLIGESRADQGLTLSEKDIVSIASYDLDVVFCSGLVMEGVGELNLARYGVWTIEHISGLHGSGTVEGFWEVMEGYPILTLELKRQDPSLPRGQVLCRSFLPTHLPDDLWSVHGAYNRLLWTAATLLQRKLSDLCINGPQALLEARPTESLEPLLFNSQPPPANKKMLKLVAKRTAQRIGAWVKSQTGFDQWCLGYRLRESVEDVFGFRGWTKMVPPKDRFWADPFPVKHQDRFFIFLEEFLYSTKKGHISVIRMDANGRWQKPETVLERDYHLSYPCVFQWDGVYYMVPESGSNRTIELYRCSSFPLVWELDRILMEDIEGADPTLEEIDGMWWLFTATKPYDVPRDDNYMDLSIFSADTPLGPWKPHQNNPVKSDARSSRPAGRLFRRYGELFRPAQDCSGDYGYAVSINKVLKLSTDEFDEEEVSRVPPDWIAGAKCIHTLNSCERLTVLDWVRTVSKV
ncbi:MAG: hypothetical protein NTW27_01435 [Deltaproteobacteria bacterium]|nr:hypothetical protein [Deltaproteobacteria bacterium]